MIGQKPIDNRGITPDEGGDLLSPGSCQGKHCVSIIVCTRNRAESLGPTLRALDEVSIPKKWCVELIVVDNASTDSTAGVVRSAQMKNFNVRYLCEGRPGKSNALNTGVASAQGEVLVFTDDDVVPARDWLEKIATPLLQRECDGVMGQVQLADDLWRPWMRTDHKLALSAAGVPTDQSKQFYGVNMGLHRDVFKRIPAFDPELGPGAIGFGEETLLGWQMGEAGFRLKPIPEALVVHHPQASRLKRSQWLQDACKRGAAMAYILHHWQHGSLKQPLVRFCYLSAKLFLRRLFQPPSPLGKEGCPTWEMSYVANIEMCRQFLKERRRPRNYDRRGLQKKPMRVTLETRDGEGEISARQAGRPASDRGHNLQNEIAR